MAAPPQGGPGRGFFTFMLIFKILFAIVGLIGVALSALYIAHLYSYDNDLMPNNFFPGDVAVPYLPVADTSTTDLTQTHIYYPHSSRSQIALGAVTFLHAAVAILVSCCLKKRLKGMSIGWTIAGFLNAATALITVGLTFSENNSSGRSYPNLSNNTVRYWVYGHYSAEEWVCGNGADFVKLQFAQNGGTPLGGKGIEDDFSKYCKEAKGAKYVSIIILLMSAFLTFMGLVLFFKQRSAKKAEQMTNHVHAHNPEPLDYNQQPPMQFRGSDSTGAYSSGEEGYMQKPGPIAPY